MLCLLMKNMKAHHLTPILNSSMDPPSSTDLHHPMYPSNLTVLFLLPHLDECVCTFKQIKQSDEL